jgi:hypothetical protein
MVRFTEVLLARRPQGSSGRERLARRRRQDADLARITLDIAQSGPEPEHWLYWRTLVEARVTGWDAPVRGWLEARRYGVA